MPLTQMQIIQALGDAMSWFERELGWGVPPTELRHLNGRIGELYAALITNGQMAPEVNQRGYDVVAESGERISVKTTGMMNSSGQISFNSNTLDDVDRVIILRMNTDEMQIETLLNETIKDTIELMTSPNKDGKRSISLSKLVPSKTNRSDIPAASTVRFRSYTVTALENGTITVFSEGKSMSPAKPVLRKIAAEIGVSLLNSNGNPCNTRQLGSLVMSAITNLDPVAG